MVPGSEDTPLNDSTQSHEISRMLPRIKAGDDQAVAVVWRKYFEQLVRYSRRKLGELPRRAVDEEDVALSAMYSFCRGMEAGKFENVDDRHDLWKLLVTITARKVCAKRRHEYAAKRDVRRVVDPGVLNPNSSGDGCMFSVDQLGGPPTQEMADSVVANCHQLLDCLDEKCRQVALWTLEGYSNNEIADKLGCVRRTVERKLERIRSVWSRQGFGLK